MRYPSEHKETVRARIVAAAARALRRDGIAGVSIPKLMKEAGLTHGGFYAHFESRDELVAEAVGAAADDTAARVLTGRGRGVAGVLAAYLSPDHARNPEEGCVLAALGTEGRRQSTPVRRAFARAARGFVQHLEASLHPHREDPTPSDEALELAARMVGAVVLARLIGDEQLSARLLRAAQRP